MCYVGLDISLSTASVCVVDQDGAVLCENVVAAEVADIARFLKALPAPPVRVGLEAGPLSEWITARLIDHGFIAISLECRQVKAALSAMPVKTDRNDARGIAQVVRTGWFKAVHVKTIDSQHARTLVTARKHLVRSVAATEQVIRGLLRPFGLKVGPTTKRSFAGRVRELLGIRAALVQMIEPMLTAREALLREANSLHRSVLSMVRGDEVCRRLMTMPGIGPVTALTFRATIDEPDRFRRSRSVGAYLGLTPRRYQSGEVDRVGRITKVGDGETRTALFEAANVVLRPGTRWSPMKAWAMRVADRQGMKRAKVALARKMAVALHCMWRDNAEFRWGAVA